MADNPLKRYLDAGVAFTAMTQAKAEEIVRDLVKAGEVQTEQAQAAVNDLLDRSRENTERLLETVRTEVRQQVETLGLVGQAELARLEKRIEALTGRTPTSSNVTSGASSSSGAGTTSGTKAPAKKRASKKRATKKAAAKRKASTKKTSAKRKASAKKAATRKAPAKKRATKKKAGAKKAAAKKRS